MSSNSGLNLDKDYLIMYQKQQCWFMIGYTKHGRNQMHDFMIFFSTSLFVWQLYKYKFFIITFIDDTCYS